MALAAALGITQSEGAKAKGHGRSMNGTAARRASLVLGLSLAARWPAATIGWRPIRTLTPTAELNEYPANYKSEILSAMHAYLNDPTGIRDAAISEPALKPTVAALPRAISSASSSMRKRTPANMPACKEIAGDLSRRPVRSVHRNPARSMRRRGLYAVPGTAKAAAVGLGSALIIRPMPVNPSSFRRESDAARDGKSAPAPRRLR